LTEEDISVVKKPANKKRMKPRPVHSPAEFGLDVLSGDDDMFRWFLLCFLLGKPIQSTVAVRTWQLFLKRKVDLPWLILDTSDAQLAQLLRSGGYTRYQHVMTRALKQCMQQLTSLYEGSLYELLESCENEEELGKRLRKLYGVGPKTAEIFMRETEEYFARRNE
jgi:endonuclease III